MGWRLFRQGHRRNEHYQEEIFGPVLCIVRWPDLRHGVKTDSMSTIQANGTQSSAREADAARQFCNEIQGPAWLGVNVPIPCYGPFHKLPAAGSARCWPLHSMARMVVRCFTT